MERVALMNLHYLAASAFFIVGVKGLSHPRTAVRGNLMAGIGMLIACFAVLMGQHAVDLGVLALCVAVGSAIGGGMALRVRMTGMPQLVAVFNGFGGAASALVAAAAMMEVMTSSATIGTQMLVAGIASAVIGAVTFTGSLVAFGKLAQLLPRGVTRALGRRQLTVIAGLTCVATIAWAATSPSTVSVWSMVAAASLFGIVAVMPVGGADMPVVISLLNSYSGLAAAATGFVLGNNALIIAGSLVGASGAILTTIMCRAMNRSLVSVLIGGKTVSATGEGEDIYEGNITRTSADEVAMLLDAAQRVVIVPGYGMAVAQAQHAASNLAQLLNERGVEVEYGIHPVAGRMPGHMNVLLAEADVPYDVLRDMDQINPTFAQTDIAIVIGANDVVNPLAQQDPNSPIAGMPILEVGRARTVVVIKRSLSPGFAGVPNPLFTADNTLMLFDDGRKALQDLVTATKGN